MPASVSSRIARRRASGELVRGSITRASFGVERGDRDADADGVMGGQCCKQIDVAGHECVLGDDADRLPALGRDGEAARG